MQGVWLHKLAAQKLNKALVLLNKEHPGWSFIIWDALRPPAAQQALYDVLRGTPLWYYVSNPKRGSVHSFGLALDIGLADEFGSPIDMGTDFDNFTALA